MADPRIITYDSDAEVAQFWRRIPGFFLLPFHGDLLLMLLLLSFAGLLGHLVPLPRPLDFIVVEGLIWLAALRHAFNTMEAISQGMLTAAHRESALPQPERANLPWKMLGVMVVWGFLIGLIGALIGPTTAQIASLLFSICLPASIMALSASNSFGQGLNPGAWIWIIRQVGKPYLALCFFLLLLSGGGAITLPLVAPLLGGWLTLPVINFVFLYFNLIMFAMMGYVLYQYHQALGLEVKVSFAKNAAAAQGRPGVAADPVGERIAAKIAAGDILAALDDAYEQQRLEADNVAVQERYHRLLLLAEKKERALDHGHRYLALLLRRGHGDAALDLFMRLRAVDAAFFPDQPGQVLPLAEAAFKRKQADLVIALVRGIEQKHPRHDDVAAGHFLLARLMSEQQKKDPLAADILRRLCKRFPDHAVAAEAQAYLKVIESVAREATR